MIALILLVFAAAWAIDAWTATRWRERVATLERELNDARVRLRQLGDRPR